MSEHMFGGGKGEVGKAEAARIDRAIAKTGHEATFTNVKLPGDGWRYWFAGPNRGEPFDRQMAAEVLDAVGPIKLKNRAAASLGRKGGESGTGAAKARTPEQASAAGKAGAVARWGSRTE
jgi:hypothetical protein